MKITIFNIQNDQNSKNIFKNNKKTIENTQKSFSFQIEVLLDKIQKPTFITL